MSRFASDMTVVFWEEPVEIEKRETAFLKVRQAEDFPNVRIVTPHLPQGLSEERREKALKRLLDAHVASCARPLVAWYYTPMMLPFSRHLDASAIVYDCMDELSKFRFAPERLLGWFDAAGFSDARVVPLPADPDARGPALFVATARWQPRN